MAGLEEKTRRVNATLERAVSLAEYSDIKPGSKLPLPISEEERDERVHTFFVTEGFDAMKHEEIWPLAWPRGEEPHPDSDEGILMRAARIAYTWRSQAHDELSHLWNRRYYPEP